MDFPEKTMIHSVQWREVRSLHLHSTLWAKVMKIEMNAMVWSRFSNTLLLFFCCFSVPYAVRYTTACPGPSPILHCTPFQHVTCCKNVIKHQLRRATTGLRRRCLASEAQAPRQLSSPKNGRLDSLLIIYIYDICMIIIIYDTVI